MRTLWNVVAVLLLLHVLALAGLLLWLRSTGRLDKARLQRVVQIFKPTIAAEAAQAKQAQEAAAKSKQAAAALQRQLELAKGPVSTADRLSKQTRAQTEAMLQAERIQTEVQQLQQQIELAQRLLASQRAELDAKEKAFAAAVKQQHALANDADFRQAVQMYEQIPAKQAKQMFQDLMQKGNTEQVVNYLAAMQLRKAAAVLKEFKTPQEIVQATDLVQRLRRRGIDPPANPARMANPTNAPVNNTSATPVPATQGGAA